MKEKQTNERVPLLVICGPTASGKTRLAVDLAMHFKGEVVSADSMQIYQKMDIGTAKPTMEEMRGIPHHLIDIIGPHESFSLVNYLELARKKISEITGRGRLPILAGGTGLYIHSLIDNIQFADVPADDKLKNTLLQEAGTQGAKHMWLRLQEVDPTLAERLHPNNQGRVIRALEVFLLTGIPMSEWQRRSRQQESPYRLCMLGLNFQQRQHLYNRIDSRVDEMISQGLLDEATALYQMGNLSQTATQAIGYKELFAHFAGKADLTKATEEIKQQSRRYAKRQLTWLRKDERIHWLLWESFSAYDGLLEKAVSLTQTSLF